MAIDSHLLVRILIILSAFFYMLFHIYPKKKYIYLAWNGTTVRILAQPNQGRVNENVLEFDSGTQGYITFQVFPHRTEIHPTPKDCKPAKRQSILEYRYKAVPTDAEENKEQTQDKILGPLSAPQWIQLKTAARDGTCCISINSRWDDDELQRNLKLQMPLATAEDIEQVMLNLKERRGQQPERLATAST